MCRAPTPSLPVFNSGKSFDFLSVSLFLDRVQTDPNILILLSLLPRTDYRHTQLCCLALLSISGCVPGVSKPSLFLF